MTKWLRGTPDIARPLRTDATRVGAVASTTRAKRGPPAKFRTSGKSACQGMLLANKLLPELMKKKRVGVGCRIGVVVSCLSHLHRV